MILFSTQCVYAEPDKKKFSVLLNNHNALLKESVINQLKALNQEAQITELSKNCLPQNIKADFDYEELGNKIKEIRTELCKVNKGGSYKIWLALTGSAGIMISASAETGFKAIIHCAQG